MTKYVAYYRVSTQKQGKSGLRLDGQQAGIEAFCGKQLIGNFIEIESGGKTSRKELAKAIELCQKKNTKLIGNQLDRVLRKLEILVALRLNKALFTALDCLNDSDMIINIKATLAEDELRKISEQTRAALHQKKARGFTLGKPEKFCDENRRKETAVDKEAARIHPANQQAAELIRLYQRDKLTMRAVAERLNKTVFRKRKRN